jgi:hypothetical protein
MVNRVRQPARRRPGVFFGIGAVVAVIAVACGGADSASPGSPDSPVAEPGTTSSVATTTVPPTTLQPTTVPPTTTPAEPARWLQGQVHAHTGVSDDSEAPIEDMVQRYEELGYDFLVITDHNVTTDATDHDGPMVVYVGIELGQEVWVCEPQPYDDSEECRIHISVLFSEVIPREVMYWPMFLGGSPLGLSDYLLGAARPYGGIAVVNHPSQYWAIDGELLYKQWLLGASMVEIANMGTAEWLDGSDDLGRPGAEQAWDDALTAGARLFGVASDDSHIPDEAGFGWVMVHAANTEESILHALEAGDFYSSTGVGLAELERSDAGVRFVVDGSEPHLIEWIGPGGAVFSASEGLESAFAATDVPTDGYVRARITAPDGTRAWVQPLWAAG